MTKKVQIKIKEIKRADLNASLIAQNIGRQLVGRGSFRKAMKQAVSNAMRAGAQGIKVRLSGRLGGADMSRTEEHKEGRVPLHTLRADIDYCLAEALTKVGLLGIKVWICRGEVYGKRDLAPNFAQSKESGFNNNQAGGRNFKRKKNNNR